MNSAQIVNLLNEMYAADKVATYCLMCNHVPANRELLNHPSIVVDSFPTEEFITVGLLGVINGILAIDGDIVEMVFKESSTDGPRPLIGFRLR